MAAEHSTAPLRFGTSSNSRRSLQNSAVQNTIRAMIDLALGTDE
jgi:hypothetical protein